jgi:hypothetical protein
MRWHTHLVILHSARHNKINTADRYAPADFFVRPSWRTANACMENWVENWVENWGQPPNY